MSRDENEGRRAAWAIVVALLAGGCGTTAVTPGPQHLRVERVSVLADGSIVIGGVAERRRGGEDLRDCDGQLALVRLDARGELDAGFGDGGAVRVRADGKGCVSSVDRLVPDPGGRTLVGTTIFQPSDSPLDDNSSQRGDLTAVTAQGDVDGSFEGDLSGFRFAVSPDGSIFDELGSRYMPGGDRDPRDRQGRVELAVDLAVDVAAQPDGTKLFLGLQDRRNHRRLAVQRFGPDWRPDTGFGERGTATTDIAPGERLVRNHPELQRLVAAPDGAVIAFGLTFGPTRSYAFAIKFDAAGRLDRSFGDRGRVELGGPAGPSKDVYDLAVRPDGSLLAIGSVGPERARRLFVARYDANGRPDRRLGRSRAIVDRSWAPRNIDPSKLNRGNRAAAITAGPDGTTVGVASLRALDGSAVESLVFRLRPDGTLDPSFGRHGVKRIERLG